MDETRPLTAQLARALIRSLNRGTAVANGARFIHVGQQEWLAAQLEMLDEVAEDGHAETKFVRGAYGTGKSHFLSVVQDFARERNWATSHVECKTDRVEIDRFETLYPRIAEKLLTPDSKEAPELVAGVDPLGRLLHRWSKKVMKKVGLRENALTRPFDADERVYGYFERELFRSGLPPQFIHGILAYCRASLENDVQMASTVVAWLKGGPETLRVPGRYLANPKKKGLSAKEAVFRPVCKGTAHDAMRALLWLIRDAGYAGLVLCVDEVEELARLGTQKRQDQALQALREFVDHAGGEGGYQALCMYLAATPEMFESDRYFPRYDALATRIQPFGEGVNWRGPVVDLERKPLNRVEMASIGEGIVRVYSVAYDAAVISTVTAEIVKSVVDVVMASRHRLAKPRFLARLLVDQLEKARNDGPKYVLPRDLGDTAARAAAAVLASASA